MLKRLLACIHKAQFRRDWNHMPSRELPLRAYRIPTEDEATAEFKACMERMAKIRGRRRPEVSHAA